MSDTVKMKHHAIAIPSLTPADRILEAARQLDDVMRNQPKQAPMEDLQAIEVLREVLLGERVEPVPPNNLQLERQRQKELPAGPTSQIPAAKANETTISGTADDKQPAREPNYVSDDEEDEGDPTSVADFWRVDELPPNHQVRRSKRVMQQIRQNNQDGLHRIVALAANETAVVPGVEVNKHAKYARGYAGANQRLQLDEWVYDFVGAIIDEKTGEKLEYRDLIKRPELRQRWETSLANELGRLAQGIRDIKGTDTIHFVSKSEIPADRWKDIMYGKIVVEYKPDKTEKHRSRLTVGGDRISYPYDVSAPTCGLPVIKLLWNSVLSTPGARYFTMDVKNFYLGTPMKRPEYMRLPIKIIPQEIVDKYDLRKLEDNGWVYVKIIRGMYSLPQAGILANEQLQ